MSIDTVIQELGSNDYVVESYILIREIKAYLNFEDVGFNPLIRIKIYQSDVIPDNPYHFDTSHHVQTPVQAGPYHPSRTMYETERAALSQALNSLTSFINSAIRDGHNPDNSWLIINDDF